MKRQRIYSLLLVAGVILIMLIIISACTPSATPEPAAAPVTTQETSKGIEYAIVSPLIHSFFIPAQEGAAQAAEDLGIDYVWLAPPTYSLEKEIQMAESALTYPNLKGITLISADAEGLRGVTKQATERGIAVAAWAGCDPDPTKQAAPICWAGDFYQMGITTCKRMAEEMGGEGEVVIAQEMVGDQNQDQRKDGCISELEKNWPKIKVVDVLTTCNPEGTTACAETALAAHPNMKGYYGTGQNSVIGAVSVFPKAGAEGIVVAAADDPPETLEGIRKGVITFTYSQIPYASGYLSVYVPYMMATKGLKPTKPWIDLGVVIVDKNNVDTYTEDVQARTKELLKTADEYLGAP